MQDMGAPSPMSYFLATWARALQPVQHGQQQPALHHGKQPPRPALSMAAPRMHGKPKQAWQQQAKPQSLTMCQWQMHVSQRASSITVRAQRLRRAQTLPRARVCSAHYLPRFCAAYHVRH